MNQVILIDAGTGNLRSVQKALEALGADVLRTDDPTRILWGKRVLLPGVGAFGRFMAGLHAHGLDDAIQELVDRGIPLLGICVGMQALFDVSDEMGQHAGLSLLRGQVTRFAESLPVKVPHTGWNQLDVRIEAPLLCGIRPQSYVYFNHSYYCQPADPIHITATASHGLIYACAVQDKNTFGVQFHPEKSQAVGLQVLKNFLELR